MKLTSAQVIALVIAAACAVLLVIDAPFQAAASEAAANSQIVFGTLFDPPVIGGTAGRLDLPLLLLELVFVAFLGGAIFFAASDK
jgi:hypothetical protein